MRIGIFMTTHTKQTETISNLHFLKLLATRFLLPKRIEKAEMACIFIVRFWTRIKKC